MENTQTTGSYFDGEMARLWGFNLLRLLLGVLSFGLLFPWISCKMHAWKISHTVVDGRRLVFTGTAAGLYKQWAIILLLCIVTLGLYVFGVEMALEKWRVQNTHFKD